jgi:hypothetical protein
MGFPYREVPVELLSQYFELPTLEARRNMHGVVFLFKLVNNLIDSPVLLSLIHESDQLQGLLVQNQIKRPLWQFTPWD